MITKKELSYLDILGLNEDATLDDIKSSYKKLAQIYHPDKYRKKSEKIEAEKTFRVLKKAYDELIKIFQEEQQQIFEYKNIYSNIEFIKFFVDNNIDINQYKSKKYSKSYKNKSIAFMNRQIDYLSLDLRYVYNCISKSKLFINWEVDSKIELDKLIEKEIIFRNYIKSRPIYKCFVSNKSKFYKPNVNLIIKIRPEVAKKTFENEIKYKINTICSLCSGAGCKYCKKGILSTTTYKRIYFTNIENNSLYKIKNYGSNLDIVNGNLNIKFLYDKNLKKKYDVYQKNYKWEINWFNNFEKIKNQFNLIISFVKKHKIHFIYTSILIVMFIILMLLIFLV